MEIKPIQPNTGQTVFKALLDAAPDATVIVDSQGSMLFVNSQTGKLFGYKKDELLGKAVEILIPSSLHRNHVKHREKYAKDPHTRSMGVGLELEAVKKDGTKFQVEISLSPLQTEEGILISASIRDITERKKAEQKFRALIDAAPDATVIVDGQGIMQIVNSQTEKLFGYKKIELLGKTVEMLIPAALHRNHVKHRENYTSDPHVRSMGAGLELEAVKKDGTKFPVEISLSPLQTEEGILISASIRDITERKKLENELKKFNEELEEKIKEKTSELTLERNLLRTLIDNLPDYIYIKDRKYQFILVNKSLIKLVGSINEHEVIGKTSMDLFGTEVGKINMEEDKKVFETGKEVIDRLEPIITYRGEKRWLLTSKIPIKDRRGLFAAIVGISKDITDRKIAEEELKRSFEETRQLASHLQNVREEERIHIAREIHDELGQQLTGLKMDVHSLNKQLANQENEKVKTKLTDILELTDEIVKSVRSISSNLRPSVLDDLGLIAALEWQSQEVEKKSEIRVDFLCEQQDIELPLNIVTGVFRIYQEALNNAVKHSNAYNIFSRLKLKNNLLTLEITDDGKGMNQESDSKKTFGLLGIKERVYIMNGKFEMKSEQGKGTQICISIPCPN
jgi:PAS domain S-box-containing protein